MMSMRKSNESKNGRQSHPYTGKVAVLSTKHEKLPLIGPPLERTVGMHVEAIAVDTDSLGTFSGDIPRLGSPLETAIAKAHLGMSATGNSIGIASEGSIGPDPQIPFVNADLEVVVLVDGVAGIVISEVFSSRDIMAAETTSQSGNDLEQFLFEADFPSHQMIVRPNSGEMRPIYKGIANVDELNTAISSCAPVSTDGLAYIGTDLRAHACPSRQKIIVSAAERLGVRVASLCPACGIPGWGRVDILFGIPCAWCGTPVAKPRAEINACVVCDHRETRQIVSEKVVADPATCPECNP